MRDDAPRPKLGPRPPTVSEPAPGSLLAGRPASPRAVPETRTGRPPPPRP